MAVLIPFIKDSISLLLKGNRTYWGWLGFLGIIIMVGITGYGDQMSKGLIVTGMSDQVSWGFYISNFTYLVGVAAAAVMLVIPAYIFHREDMKEAVILGESIAVGAVVMCILFVTADMGRPDRIWHMIPLLGRYNFPLSILAWDVLVLSGYLVINLALITYVLMVRHQGREPVLKHYFWAVIVSIFWAISIHTVTAFLYSGNAGRAFWHTAVLAPRFLASAFSSGPALIVIILQVVDRFTEMKINQRVIDLIVLIITVSLQIHIFFIGVEIFTEFYNPTEHSASAYYLFFGLGGYSGLVPWIWTSVSLSMGAAAILMVHPWRKRKALRNTALVMIIVGIWIEKGMGLVIPGFLPTPIGEILEYTPTVTELMVTAGIWAIGILVFTLVAKVAIPITLGSHLKAAGGDKKQD